ncbi:MAG TPA: alpha/beta family hydrolase [Longimicrobiales bacterium]|nr:alpha/beta family hydrolase [Longimicrobiales bacterium]
MKTEISGAVSIRAGAVLLKGDLCIPEDASSIVLFAHGSGSGRTSPHNQYVAQVLQEAGLATLLFDLLTDDEAEIDERTAHLRFEIRFLAERLLGVSDWIRHHERSRSMQIGYFGASTGAAAALVAAAERPEQVSAVVSWGGRPDLAGTALARVRSATLLIVGALDQTVLSLNRHALAELTCLKELRIIPGATHRFEEPGTLEQAALHAREWFATCFAAESATPEDALRGRV